MRLRGCYCSLTRTGMGNGRGTVGAQQGTPLAPTCSLGASRSTRDSRRGDTGESSPPAEQVKEIPAAHKVEGSTCVRAQRSAGYPGQTPQYRHQPTHTPTPTAHLPASSMTGMPAAAAAAANASLTRSGTSRCSSSTAALGPEPPLPPLPLSPLLLLLPSCLPPPPATTSAACCSRRAASCPSPPGPC